MTYNNLVKKIQPKKKKKTADLFYKNMYQDSTWLTIKLLFKKTHVQYFSPN